MDTFGDSKSKTNTPGIFGRMGFFEDDFEKGITAPVSAATQAVGGFIEDIFSLGQDIVWAEPKKETNGTDKLPSNGSIEFNKIQAQNKKIEDQRKETDRKKAFYQTLKEDQQRVQRSKEDVLSEEEINDIVSNLPTEQKNQLLHYQANYRDKSIYQRAELRKKMIEEQKNAQEQKKDAAIPSPAKQINAMDAAFEGGSGKSGSGSANFSSTGGGAG